MKAGFIGLGAQGKLLAKNILNAGHELAVFDICAEPMVELSKHGAKIVLSPAEVVAHSEITAICVTDDTQLRDVLEGPTGVFMSMRAGNIVVVHSTVSPALVQAMAEQASMLGGELIDAPVSGSVSGALSRGMSFMVGGSAAALARCRPLFEASGSNITHCGPIGAGMKAKLVHQTILCVNLMAAAEGMRMGLRAGIDQDVLLKIVHDGYAQSRAADQWFEADFQSGRALFYKDLSLCLELAHELGVALPGAALTQQLLACILKPPC
jgi:3-hydroxyisobutyrate dehydrogenase-like beta-hydroxyacid dehydrogenase